MHDKEYLEEYFQICKRLYEQMERDGTWPWGPDSLNSEDVVDSEDNSEKR